MQTNARETVGVVCYECHNIFKVYTLIDEEEGKDMLKILNEKFMRTDGEMEDFYKNCKYIYIIGRYDKVVDDERNLYCVNTSAESVDGLYKERDRHIGEGKICVVSGSYNDGDSIGVQCEYKGK